MDHFSGYTSVCVLKSKDTLDNVLEHIKNYIRMMETQTGCKVKVFRTDRGGLEFCSRDVKEYFDGQGIIHEKTAPNHPAGNGRAERRNRTLFDAVRTIPRNLWGLAVEAAWHTQNRVLVSPISQKTLYAHCENLVSSAGYTTTGCYQNSQVRGRHVCRLRAILRGLSHTNNRWRPNQREGIDYSETFAPTSYSL